MNGKKLLIIGVLVGFGGGMAAAIGMKLAQRAGRTGVPVAEASGTEATPTAVAEASGAPASPVSSGVNAAPTITPFDLSPKTPVPQMDGTPRSGSTSVSVGGTPRPTATKKLAMVKGTPVPGNAIDEMPVEGPPASITFGKGGGGNAIVKIVEERHNDTSLLRVEMTGKARYKILQLPKRHELWIDFEETEVPGGEKVSAGSNVHVTEVRARVFSEPNTIARVTVRLANEGKFAVFPSKGTGEADGMLEIMLGP